MMLNLVRLSRPSTLLLTTLTYGLGAGVANYLGESLRVDALWLGFLAVLMSQLSMSLLAEVFRPPNEPIILGETLAQRRSLRNNALYISVAALSSAALSVFVLFQNARLSPLALFLLGLSMLLVLLHAVPPFRLLNHGFGEFLQAAHLAYVIPSIAFLLHVSEYHRLLAFVTIPLTAIAFAYFIVLDFPAFAADQKYERRTLLTLLGWERALPIHHALLISAYFLFTLAPFLGISFQLLWPVFITLPFALFQTITLNSIASGNPPNWTLLTVNALAVFGLTAYLLNMIFWLR
jgi:1,4-dihydroxy-2-naphthoate octaprenyltransferase